MAIKDAESANNSDGGNVTGPERTPDPRPDPAGGAAPEGRLDALNSFLERAYLKADVDTGC